MEKIIIIRSPDVNFSHWHDAGPFDTDLGT